MISPVDGQLTLAAFRGDPTPRIPVPPMPPAPPSPPKSPHQPKPTKGDIADDALEGTADAVPKIVDAEMKQAEAQGRIAQASEELKDVETKIHSRKESVGAIRKIADLLNADRRRLGCEERVRDERGRRSRRDS
jgi:hypothetical protein